MKRSPLRRRTQLPPGKPLRRSGKLRSVSVKRRRLQAQRRKALEQAVRERGPWCEFDGCRQRAVDGHEPLTRGRGGDPADLDNIVLLCRDHHEQIHSNVAEATEQGWLIPSWGAERG